MAEGAAGVNGVGDSTTEPPRDAIGDADTVLAPPLRVNGAADSVSERPRCVIGAADNVMEPAAASIGNPGGDNAID